MDLQTLFDLLRHPDTWLDTMLAQHGTKIYAFLFAIIFAETGLVVTPFLPGDSLLFAVGALSARGNLSFPLLFLILFAAAVLGDTVNYSIGKAIGPAFASGERKSRLLKKEHLDKTHAFFEKHGGKAIILGRFVPIVRTFAPFVAGMGRMSYGTFLLYNVIGGLLWVGLCIGAGYLFGNLPAVKNHFEKLVVGIVLLSVLPMVIEWINHRRNKASALPSPSVDN